MAWNELETARVNLQMEIEMSTNKEDYRTNRADHFIAAQSNTIAEQPAARKKLARLHDQRSARLAENPAESSERRTRHRHRDNA